MGVVIFVCFGCFVAQMNCPIDDSIIPWYRKFGHVCKLSDMVISYVRPRQLMDEMYMVSCVFGSSEWLVSIVDMDPNAEFYYTKPVSSRRMMNENSFLFFIHPCIPFLLPCNPGSFTWVASRNTRDGRFTLPWLQHRRKCHPPPLTPNSPYGRGGASLIHNGIWRGQSWAGVVRVLTAA